MGNNKKQKLTKQELEDLLEKRTTYEEIGKICGITRQAVALRLKRLGLTYKRANTKAKLNRSDLEKVQRLKLSSKRYQSKKDGLTCDIEWEDLSWPPICPILGIELNYFSDGREEGSSSFDQLIPGQGYTKENTRIISWRANRIKNDGTAEEHQKIADYMRLAEEDRSL